MEKTILEKNEVIADFMGLYKSDINGFGGVTYGWFDKKTSIKQFEGNPKYDSDWNMLMLVVEKVEDICDLVLGNFLVEISGGECIIYHFDFNWANGQEFIKVNCAAEKRKAVFEAVYSCIESINEQAK